MAMIPDLLFARSGSISPSMDLTVRTLWQVGAGDNERSFGDICQKFDVMVVGPGNPGQYSHDRHAAFGEAKNEIRRFYEDAKRGDIVLLRRGTSQIIAIGEIADDTAQWLQAFADIDGWDLQHVRRVRWFVSTARDFPGRTLGGQVRSFAKVGVDVVREWVESLDVGDEQLTRPLAQLPEDVPQLDRSELGRRLFIEGLPSE
jgi:hypothetical protein